MKEKVRVAVIGLGRGDCHACNMARMSNCEVVAVCDLFPDRIERVQNNVEGICGRRPAGYTDYKKMYREEHLDGVIIATSWTTHTRLAVDAMKAGIIPASEVYGASSIEECWQIVRAYEETGVECMFLENCNYGREELCLLNMVKQGLFGEIIHCECGYEHDLRGEVTMGIENRHYRFKNYEHRNGDVYPTHGLAPMAKLLGINHGNRFMSIVSVASKQRGLNLYASEHFGSEHPANNTQFNMGDVVNSIIKCANGETILLTHATSLQRPYSRAGVVQGTKGIWMEDKAAAHIVGMSGGECWDAFGPIMDKYDHDIWKMHNTGDISMYGHGGMDFIVDSAFVDMLVTGCHSPIDAYDWASVIATTVLSEQSVALGGMPQLYPDFTNGSWLDGTVPVCEGKYALNL